VTEDAYKNNVYAPGVFEVTIEGVVDGSEGPSAQDAII
jgi:hypothetical protein